MLDGGCSYGNCPHLLREHHKEYEDGKSLQTDEDGVDVGHKEEVSVEDQETNDPRDTHDNHQRDGGLQPVPGGGADMGMIISLKLVRTY